MIHDINEPATLPNTAYMLRANALALRDIAPFGRNVVYAGNVMRSIPLLKSIHLFDFSNNLLQSTTTTITPTINAGAISGIINISELGTIPHKTQIKQVCYVE